MDIEAKSLEFYGWLLAEGMNAVHADYVARKYERKLLRERAEALISEFEAAES